MDAMAGQESTMSENKRRVGSQLKELLGSPGISFRETSGGYTPAARWIVGLADGRSVFVKMGIGAETAGWLRDERFVYERLRGGFLPRLLGFAEGENGPLLVLEDMSQAVRPPVSRVYGLARAAATCGQPAIGRGARGGGGMTTGVPPCPDGGRATPGQVR